ncbi:small serum protein 2-like [Anolis carolinensis]|uniref:small serum protein 2-like n=1 Tax=Anolis carolinensis TaxID=28377 RepID=UPI002F2B8D80
MNALFRLGVLCVVLAVCHGACFRSLHELVIEDGKLVEPVCVDVYDMSKHPIGDSWNTAQCMECHCGTDEMECCTRYGGIADMPGCKAVVDETTCKYKFYKKNDPSKPCF